MSFETVIGLEIHTQLATKSKIFSGSSTQYGAAPNTQASLVDLGYPGVLPVFNGAALDMAIMFGLATGCSIAPRSVFARKNYFYPDLPKGYQISQYELPIVYGGSLEIAVDGGSRKTIGITRAHLEEDAGKSIHDAYDSETGVDLNRAGTPLLEIVSEPDLRSAEEAVIYMRKVHTLVRYLGISDGNMQEGSFRCDANVSVRPWGQAELGTRTELKNLNSFRFVERAIQYEIERQIDVIEDGGAVVQETRLYDPDRHETRPMRSKEEAHDYRYFPDPDLLPLIVDEARISQLRERLPELPEAKAQRFSSELGLSTYDAEVLTATKEAADYFEAVVAGSVEPKLAANWVMGEVTAAANREDVDFSDVPVTPASLAELLGAVSDGTVSGRAAKEVFEALWAGEGGVTEIIDARGLRQVSDAGQIEAWVDEVLASFPDQVGQYRGGNTKVIGFFVGQVMKLSKGQANPGQVNALLKTKL